ncbi:hypothetical protein BC830DRAFT_519308 [Chytriomyces sp. MP71]|nr:hypothetical protein BC830DRAFT_519308 [Chytriomyces sp. MP71]
MWRVSTPQQLWRQGMPKFQQDAPAQPPNAFLADRALVSIVQRRCAGRTQFVHSDLERFGNILASPEVLQFGHDANANLPVLRQFDQWGQRIDRIDTAHGWKALKDLAATEGLIATGYEREHAKSSIPRIHQYIKLYMFAPKSALVSCPLAMTDGATRVFELLGNSDITTKQLKAEFLPRLLSRDPRTFITSGQWMTEKPGGSDVGNTETLAVPSGDTPNAFTIHGQKWFSSATDADIAFLLAREAVSEGQATGNLKKVMRDGCTFVDGSRGLSLFFAQVWVHDPAQKDMDLNRVHHHAHRSVQKLNGIRVVALKNKFGTKSLPTAELELDGMRATRFGDPLRGIKAVSTMLNITRLHTAVTSVGAFRHCLFLAKSFATKRVAFGAPLARQPLQARVLADLEITCTAHTHAAMYVVDLLGRTETDPHDGDAGVLLRFLTPVMKAWCAKTAVVGISECMEALGGVGYIEESGIGLALRDMQVNAIWEGASNVMSLDVLRVLKETRGEAINVFVKAMTNLLHAQPMPASHPLATCKSHVEVQLKSFVTLCKTAAQKEVASRTLLYLTGRIVASVLLIDEAIYTREAVDEDMARRWVLGSTNGLLFGVSGDVGEEFDGIDADARIAFSGAKL